MLAGSSVLIIVGCYSHICITCRYLPISGRFAHRDLRLLQTQGLAFGVRTQRCNRSLQPVWWARVIDMGRATAVNRSPPSRPRTGCSRANWQ
jgi:hypothetical protein